MTIVRNKSGNIINLIDLAEERIAMFPNLGTKQHEPQFTSKRTSARGNKQKSKNNVVCTSKLTLQMPPPHKDGTCA